MNSKPRLCGLLPIIPECCRILILGSMPSVQSLLRQEYYGHPQNQFWKILFDLFKEPFSTNYAKKKQLLSKYRIGLWDMIGSCQRQGSSDSAIEDEEINDIAGILKSHPTIQAIFFDGKKSCELYQRNFSHLSVHAEYLPSTSPLHTQPLTYKMEEWKKLLRFVEF